jgi:hypothetical protein
MIGYCRKDKHNACWEQVVFKGITEEEVRAGDLEYILRGSPEKFKNAVVLTPANFLPKSEMFVIVRSNAVLRVPKICNTIHQMLLTGSYRMCWQWGMSGAGKCHEQRMNLVFQHLCEPNWNDQG